MTISEKLTAMAENQQRVYDAGYAKGQAEADTEAAYNEGVQAEYDRFWDAYQHNGNRTDYQHGFRGIGWSDENFYPKYDIAPQGNCTYLFCETLITDLKARLDECGVVLDTSKATSLSNLFYNSTITKVGTIDVGQCSSLQMFNSSDTLPITSIEKLKLSTADIHSYPNTTFAKLVLLEEIRIEGIIYKSIYFHHSPLTKASIESVMAALSDTTTGTTASFKQTAVDTAFETAEGLADGSASDAWLELVATKENWTISLV